MNEPRFCLLDYVFIYSIILLLLWAGVFADNEIFTIFFVTIVIFVCIHIVLRVSICAMLYHVCEQCRERRQARREARDKRVKEVLQRAREAYLEHMTND